MRLHYESWQGQGVVHGRGKAFVIPKRDRARYTVTHGYRSHHEFARGNVHVNRVENAWGLFKRGLMGVYHHVNAKYLQEYLDEFAFRQSNLKNQGSLVAMVLVSL